MTGNGLINMMTFSRDGHLMAAVAQGGIDNTENTLRLWDVATGKKIREFPGHGGGTPALARSRDGQTLLTADTVVRLWDWQTGKEKREPPDNPGSVSALAFLPDGRSLVTGANGLAVWAAGAGSGMRRPIGPRGQVDGIAHPFTIKILAGPAEIVLTVDKVEHNVDIPEARFALPKEITRLVAKQKK